jgi:hypothetical protein
MSFGSLHCTGHTTEGSGFITTVLIQDRIELRTTFKTTDQRGNVAKVPHQTKRTERTKIEIEPAASASGLTTNFDTDSLSIHRRQFFEVAPNPLAMKSILNCPAVIGIKGEQP